MTETEQAAWYRSIGDFYAKYALDCDYTLAKEMNAAEAQKYYGMAERLERISTRA